MPKSDRWFRKGHAGGPGRPLGSKNKLSESFLHALAEDFEKHGKDAIARICKTSPGEYLRIIAGLVPKELLLEVAQEEKINWVINAQPELTLSSPCAYQTIVPKRMFPVRYGVPRHVLRCVEKGVNWSEGRSRQEKVEPFGSAVEWCAGQEDRTCEGLRLAS